MGIKIDADIADLAADLLTTYTARGWAFSASILRLNFNFSNSLDAFIDIFSTLGSAARSLLPIKSDEIRFLSKIIERISAEGGMPFVAIVSGLETTVAWADADMDGKRNAEILRPLYHALKDAEYRELSFIERTTDRLQRMSPEEMIAVSFVFSEKPLFSFPHWLDQLHERGLLEGPLPKFRNSTFGSYIEIFYLSVGSLSGIIVCLSLLSRIVDGLVDLRARTEILISGTLPASVRRKALQPAPMPSAKTIQEIQRYLNLALDRRANDLLGKAQEFSDRLVRVEMHSPNE